MFSCRRAISVSASCCRWACRLREPAGLRSISVSPIALEMFAAISGLAARAYSRWHLSELHRPLFNLVITNVPGPQRPLTLDGAPLLAYAGAAPLADGLRLILPVYSYRGTLSVGITADREAMPDPAGFAAALEDALDELEAAVGAAPKP